MAVVQTDGMGSWRPVDDEDVERIGPKPTTFDGALKLTLMEVEDLLLRKHHDYGKGNIAKFGEYGVLVRASDKIERLINLISTINVVKNETRMDSWFDLIGYGVIAIMWLRGWFELPDLKVNEEEDV